MEIPDFPPDTIYPRLDTLVHDSSNRNVWKLASNWNGTDYAILGQVRTLNHNRGELPETTIFMLKYLPYFSNPPEKATRELELQSKAARIGLAPKIIDSWNSPTGITIVMEKADIELGTLLTSYQTLETMNLIMASVLSAIRKLHLNGIYHGDIGMSNMMVVAGDHTQFAPDPQRPLSPDDPNSEVARYKAAGYRFYIIDFGEGGYIGQQSFAMIKDYIDLEGDVYDLLNDFPSAALRNVYDALVLLIKAFL